MIALLVYDKPTEPLTDGAKVVLLVVFVFALVWFMRFLNWGEQTQPPKPGPEPDPVAARRRAVGLPDLPVLPEGASPAQVELLAAGRAAFNQAADVIEELDRQVAENSAWEAAIREVLECFEKGQDISGLTPIAQRYLLHLHHKRTNPPIPEEVAADREAEIAAADREIATWREFLSRPTATGDVRTSLEICLRNAEERRHRAEER